MEGPSLEQRWLKCLETLNLDQIDEFRKRFKNISNTNELVIDMNLKVVIITELKTF